MYFLSCRGAEEPTVYGWNTKVSAPFIFMLVCLLFVCLGLVKPVVAQAGARSRPVGDTYTRRVQECALGRNL